MIQKAIYQALNGENLTLEDTKVVMDQIMSGSATQAQIAGFLTAMRYKGETIEEITACAMVMREHCTKLAYEGDLLEIVGTGGDEAYTFNISTCSAFVISAAGMRVGKHGNRSVSSKCGSADVLEALGAKIDLTPEQSVKLLEETGMCFMFAPHYHASMKYAAPVRKELGVRTIFNILGPLANPAQANHQLLGVYDENLVEPLARVLSNLGIKRAMVVHGHDGLDEISLCARTTVCEVNDGILNSFFLDPEQFGFTLCQSEDMVGGGPEENAGIVRDVLSGKDRGPKRDVVLLNTAVCLYMGDGATTLRDCVRRAADTIDSGAAYTQMERFVACSQRLGEVGS